MPDSFGLDCLGVYVEGYFVCTLPGVVVLGALVHVFVLVVLGLEVCFAFLCWSPFAYWIKNYFVT